MLRGDDDEDEGHEKDQVLLEHYCGPPNLQLKGGGGEGTRTACGVQGIVEGDTARGCWVTGAVAHKGWPGDDDVGTVVRARSCFLAEFELERLNLHRKGWKQRRKDSERELTGEGGGLDKRGRCCGGWNEEDRWMDSKKSRIRCLKSKKSKDDGWSGISECRTSSKWLWEPDMLQTDIKQMQKKNAQNGNLIKKIGTHLTQHMYCI